MQKVLEHTASFKAVISLQTGINKTFFHAPLQGLLYQINWEILEGILEMMESSHCQPLLVNEMAKKLERWSNLFKGKSQWQDYNVKIIAIWQMHYPPLLPPRPTTTTTK